MTVRLCVSVCEHVCVCGSVYVRVREGATQIHTHTHARKDSKAEAAFEITYCILHIQSAYTAYRLIQQTVHTALYSSNMTVTLTVLPVETVIELKLFITNVNQHSLLIPT